MQPEKFAGRPRTTAWPQALACAAVVCALPALPFLAPDFAFVAPAYAGECNADLAKLTQKRQGIIEGLNKLAKSSVKGQLDPALSCPKLRNLADAEKELLDYLVKNKDWCMVPDDAITNITTSMNRSKTIAGKACAMAAQMKKDQASGTLGGGQKLPTGPL